MLCIVMNKIYLKHPKESITNSGTNDSKYHQYQISYNVYDTKTIWFAERVRCCVKQRNSHVCFQWSTTSATCLSWEAIWVWSVSATELGKSWDKHTQKTAHLLLLQENSIPKHSAFITHILLVWTTHDCTVHTVISQQSRKLKSMLALEASSRCLQMAFPLLDIHC